ncbi:zinc finger BED domain-containing protein 1-like [Astyanax mexicanus]|uniref:Zinc finger BED domain-containing protein 1-like n=1 Tax=Astyanax mexicanus TaxID=7994 RepID=A0A8B9GZQ4_ASTMX|nr:zinc finger BED domain-containing protein 1-like [Astyanax mexicanus]
MDKRRNRIDRNHTRRGRNGFPDSSIPFRRVFKPQTGRGRCTPGSHYHASQRREHDRHPYTRPSNIRQQSILPYTGSQTNVRKHVLNMIVRDLHPLSLVEDEGFQRLVKILHPHTDIFLSASLIREDLLNMHEEIRVKVQQEVSRAKDLVLSAEVWSSSDEASYLTVTCHFISLEWELKSYMLETVHLIGDHTPENVHQQLRRISYEWEIMEKVQVVVTNKDGMKRAKPEVRWTYMPCFGETLNKVFREAMNNSDWRDLLKKCRRIAAFFQQKTSISRNVQLTQSTGVDWLPVLTMLSNIYDQWPSIFKEFMAKQVENICLNEKERDMLNRAVNALNVIRDTVEKMGYSGYSSISNIIPLRDELQKGLGKLIQAKNNVAQRLSERCDHHIGGIRQNHWFTHSTALDPQFKSIVLQNGEDEGETIKAQLKDKMRYNRGGGHGGEMSFFEDQILHKYTAEPDWMLKSQNPLQFWATKEEYKQLSKLAHKYLTVVSTAVPLERITQPEKSQLFLNRRNCLELENISMMLFLNSNQDKI